MALRTLLSRRRDDIRGVVADLQLKLGSEAGVLCDVFPALVSLLGPQPVRVLACTVCNRVCLLWLWRAGNPGHRVPNVGR